MFIDAKSKAKKGGVLKFRPRFSFRLLFIAFLVAASITAALAQDRVNLNFAGHYRNRPKTSIVRRLQSGEISDPKLYDHLKALIMGLPSDSVMRSKYPELNSTTNFPNRRKPEELWNVEVTCWIHAVKFVGGSDGDNDFHVIIGNQSDTAGAIYLNVEVSGLPPSGKNRTILREARQKLIAIFQGMNITTSFKRISPAKKVRIRGSLFFDGDHQAGCLTCPGPSYAKPKTVWEIHPVYSIEVVP